MSETAPPVDPWVSFSRIVAGVVLYGAVGFGLDRWWGTTFMVGIGVVLGAGLGIWTVWASLRHDDMTSAVGGLARPRPRHETKGDE